MKCDKIIILQYIIVREGMYYSDLHASCAGECKCRDRALHACGKHSGLSAERAEEQGARDLQQPPLFHEYGKLPAGVSADSWDGSPYRL